MPRWSKLLLAGIAGLLVLAGGAYLGLSLAFPPERLATLLAQQVSQASGREFSIRGPLAYRLLPHIAVVAQDVALGNAPWGSRKDMLLVKRASLQLRLWPLLQGRAEVDSVSLEGVDLLLETDRAGTGNWVVQRRDSMVSAEPKRRTATLELTHLQLSDVRMAFRDARQGGAAQAIDIQHVDIQREGDEARLAAQFTLNAQAWRLAGRTGRITALLADGADWPFDLQLSSAGARLAAKGLWHRSTGSASADMSASISGVAALAPWLTHPDTVPLPIELKAALKLTPQALQADALQLSLAEQRLSGRFSVRNGSPWNLDAQLASPSIDLARWWPRAGSAGSAGIEPGSGQRWLFSDTPIAFEVPPSANAVLSLTVQRLRLPGAPELTGLNTRVTLQGSRLKAEPLNFNVAGGSARGSVTLAQGPQQPARLQLQLDITDIAVDALTQALGNSGYAKGGRVQLHTRLDLSGTSPRALAAGANGEVLVQLADTTLSGKLSASGPNLLTRLLQTVTKQPDATQPITITCAVVRLPLKGGIAMVERSIAVETDELNITASGELNLRDETLRLAFRPHARKTLSLNMAELASLVTLKGPLLDPKFSIDAAGAAGLALTLGAAGATGGLSMLGERLIRQAADPQPCRFAATGSAGAAADSAPAEKAPPTHSKAAPTPKSLPDLFRSILK